MSAILINLPKFEKFSADLDSRTGVPEFGRLAAALANTAAAIPAPFHSLTGNGHFSAAGHFDPHVGDITFKWQSRLASEERTQRGSVDGGGTLKFVAATDSAPAKMDAKAELILTDVRFSAPKLSIGGPPQVFPDPRLSAKAFSENLNAAAKRAGSSLT